MLFVILILALVGSAVSVLFFSKMINRLVEGEKK